METEINQTPETLVKELAIVSGNTFEIDVTDLSQLAAKAAAITEVGDPNFKEVKSDMVAKRNYIKEYCLAARRDIKKVAAGVSDIEGMLYDIFVPEENRLIEISKVAKEKKILEERKLALPRWKEELAEIGDGVEITDEELLKMDDTAYVAYKNARTTAKLDADKAEIEETKRKQEEEQKRLDWEAGAQEREKKAREEERVKMEAEKKAEEEQKEKDRIAAEEAEKARIAAEEKAKEEAKAKQEADARYQEWLASIGCNDNTKESFHFIDDGETIKAYRLVDVFKK